jgi:dynein heavy chain
VSRNGMIYMGVTALTWQIIIQAWLKTRSPAEVTVLEPLMRTFGDVYDFVFLETHPKMEIPCNSYISTLLILLTGLIPKAEGNKVISAEHLEKLYTFSLFWTCGSLYVFFHGQC